MIYDLDSIARWWGRRPKLLRFLVNPVLVATYLIVCIPVLIISYPIVLIIDAWVDFK